MARAILFKKRDLASEPHLLEIRKGFCEQRDKGQLLSRPYPPLCSIVRIVSREFGDTVLELGAPRCTVIVGLALQPSSDPEPSFNVRFETDIDFFH